MEFRAFLPPPFLTFSRKAGGGGTKKNPPHLKRVVGLFEVFAV